MAFTSSDFLTQLQVISSVGEGRYSNPVLLTLANGQLISVVVPLIIGLKEEYYVTNEYVDIEANQAAYPIPYRAMGLSLREVKMVINGRVIDLSRIDPTMVTSTQTGEPEGFYLEGQDVILYPTPNRSSGQLKFSYFRTPNRAVTVLETGRITNIDRVTGVISASLPTSWSTANTFDFISSQNGHQALGQDLTASSVTVNGLTFALADIPNRLSVGDYVALSGEAPFFQMPDVCFRYLLQLTANEMLNSTGSLQELQAGAAIAAELKDMVVSQLVNRVQGAPKKRRIPL